MFDGLVAFDPVSFLYNHVASFWRQFLTSSQVQVSLNETSDKNGPKKKQQPWSQEQTVEEKTSTEGTSSSINSGSRVLAAPAENECF